MTTVAPEVLLRTATLSDAPALAALAQEVFDADWTQDFVAWKYYRNPAGKAVGGCAESGGRVVASFANLPLRLKLADATVTAAQSVDAMVSTDYRRQKLFYQLAGRTNRALDEAGVVLTYVFPAPIARQAFVEQLGYLDVGLVPRFVKVVRASGLGQSLGHSGAKAILDPLAWTAAQGARLPAGRGLAPVDVRVAEVGQFDDRFDRLWQQASPVLSIATVRDSRYLTWRYGQNPRRRYLVLTVERGEALAGFAVLSIDRERQIAYLVELLVTPGDDAAGVWLLVEAAKRARQARCAQIQCWMLLHHNSYVGWLRQVGFVYAPGPATPSWLKTVTPFILRLGTLPAQAPDAARLENWYLTMGDHDFY